MGLPLARMIRLARSSFSNFRNKTWVGLSKKAGITRLAYSFDTSRLGHGDWGSLTATLNGTYIDRAVLQAGCPGGPEQNVVGKFGGGFIGTQATMAVRLRTIVGMRACSTTGGKVPG